MTNSKAPSRNAFILSKRVEKEPQVPSSTVLTQKNNHEISELGRVLGIAITSIALIFFVSKGIVPLETIADQGQIQQVLIAISSILCFSATCVLAGAAAVFIGHLLNVITAIAVRIVLFPFKFLAWILFGIK